MKRVKVLLLAAAMLLCCALPTAAADAVAAVRLDEPTGLFLRADGTLLITDTGRNNVVAFAGKEPALLAGYIASADIYGGAADGYVDTAADISRFAAPWAIAPFLDGWAVTDRDNHVVRFIVDGRVRTIAGSGQAGLLNGVGKRTAFSSPTGLAADEQGNLYVADTGNHIIRKITLQGVVSNFAGVQAGGCADGARGTARFSSPTGLCWFGGALYVCDSGNQRICKIENDTVTTLAGAAAPLYEGTDKKAGGFVDGAVAAALFDHPTGVAVTAEAVYVADTGNAAIRKIANGRVTTLLAADTLAAYPAAPTGLAVSGSTLFVADSFAGLVYTVDIGVAHAGFADVAADAPYAQAVDFVYGQGLFKGTGATAFSPADTMTRGMFAAVLARLHQSIYRGSVVGGSAAFADVAPDKYYASSVAWAADKGLVQGVGKDTFAPGAQISRVQLAAFLYRYAEMTGVDTAQAAALTCADSAAIPVWGAAASAWALSHGMIAVDAAGQLHPDAPATRAQVATALYAFDKLLIG